MEASLYSAQIQANTSKSEPEPAESQIDGGCDNDDCKEDSPVFFCNVCKSTLCSACWAAQISHKKLRLAPGSIPHEKTDPWVAKQVQKVLSPPSDDLIYHQLHLEDEETAWFGVDHVSHQEELLSFRDRGRYAELLAITNTKRVEIRQLVNHDQGQSLSGDTRTPALVSFVGQTGAGKSALIKLIIELNQQPGGAKASERFPSPVVGIPGHHIPTSEDVHLYLDPSTAFTEEPILYADCEGLDGGEQEPLGARFRKRRQSSIAHSESTNESSFKARYSSERSLAWTNSPNRRTRHFAVSNLYPRLLFTFSDVIVFVLRNPRVIEGVFERLVEWAASALETSSNQPVLPHAIIALNASENNIDPELWDVNVATERLLDALSHTVKQNVCFKKHAKIWADRKKQIDTVEQLMLSYYSSIRIVRIPAEGRPKLIQEQTQKLYAEVSTGCQKSRERKESLRMLLDAEELQSYLQCAFDHFARTLDVAFDFVQASFFNSPIPLNFGGNILKLAINMMKLEEYTTARSIFDKLSNMVASCIMQDSVRHNIKGSAELIFPQYLDHLDSALRDFCDRHWPCEYILHGAVPPHLQAYLNSLQFHHNMRNMQVSAVIYRCVNVRCGHGSKGHQLRDGRVFAVGSCDSDFSFENYHEEFRKKVYLRLDYLLKLLSHSLKKGEAPGTAAARIHRDNGLSLFYGEHTKKEARAFQSHSVCFCCLFEPPEHALPCGHVLCTPCVRSHGRLKSKNLFEIHECPLEINTPGRCLSVTLYVKPEAAGLRILTLDGGGIRSIIQLGILRLIEREMNGKLPIQCFFDMIVGTGTGGLIALGLVTQNWTIEDCLHHFELIYSKAFSHPNKRGIPVLKWIREKYNSKSDTTAFEAALKIAFSEDQHLFGDPRPSGRPGSHIQVAVTATSSAGRTVLLANYNRRTSKKFQYHFRRPEKAEMELKVWEVARATMAAPKSFKSLHHERSKQIYTDSENLRQNPIFIAHNEFKIVSEGTSVEIEYPDIVLSLETGPGTTSNRISKNSEKPSLLSHLKKHGNTKTDQGDANRQRPFLSERSEAWDSYLNLLPHSAPTSKFVRLNPIFEQDLSVPEDISSAEYIQSVVQKYYTNDNQIKSLAVQLFATLFYIDVSETILETDDNGVTVQGQVLCRLPNETAEVCEIGKLLREGSEHCQLVFQEEDGVAQRFQITTEVVQRMISNLHFRIDGIQLRVVKNLPFRAVLRWRGEEFSISGFPRILLQDPSQTMRQHQASQWTDQEKHHQKYHRKLWTVPVSDEPAIDSFGPDAAASPYELPAMVIPGSSVTEQNGQKAAQVEVPLPRGVASEENGLLGVAGPSSSWKMPALSSVAASSATFNENTRTDSVLRSYRYLTIKFSTDEELKLLNDFVQSITESHGADHTTPLLISSTNFEIGDSTRTNQLSSEILAAPDHENSVLNRDALSRASISSSIPPQLPELPWQNEPTMTFELIDM